MKNDDRIAEEIGTYEAKTRLPELIRQVQAGRRFTITNRGEPVAQLVPVQATAVGSAAEAIDRFLDFKARFPVKKRVKLRDLIDEGRA
jgi:prevent-host-death family protein